MYCQRPLPTWHEEKIGVFKYNGEIMVAHVKGTSVRHANVGYVVIHQKFLSFQKKYNYLEIKEK